MGLIKQAKNLVGGVLADQWKEYFYCEAMPETVLAAKAKKRVSSKGMNKGSDNIITNGSVVAVADGQCMMIVDQGKIAEVCAEPGEYVYDASTEPSVFSGNLGEALGQTFAVLGKRLSFGGETGKDQRVYYFNTRELTGNKYGTANPVPFRVVDTRAGIDMDVGLRCFGEYSIRLVNPLLFYKNVCGNVADTYNRSQLEGQMRTELLTALQPAFARISEQGIRYSSLPGHTMEIADALNEILSAKWAEKRGIEIVSFGISSVSVNAEDEAAMKDMQRAAALRDPGLAAARLADAQQKAMVDAANNAAGAWVGFAGMNMAQQAGGMNAAALYQMAAQQETQQAAQKPVQAPAGDSWKCSCGTVATGKFCPECGSKKPEVSGWRCSCGSVNNGKFCSECGAPKPMPGKCAQCGWEAPNPANLPRFCPECGTPFRR